MRKLLALALLTPSLAFPAAATYTNPTGTTAKIVCASGTCDAPTLATQGLNGADLTGYQVTVAADDTRTLSGAGTLLCYVYDADVGAWARVPDMDITVGTGSVQYLAFPGVWLAAPRGRIAYVPSSVTVSAGGVTIWLVGTKKP